MPSVAPTRRAASFVALILLPILLQIAPAPVFCGEARQRGKNATITWLDEAGNRRQADGREIRYGYFTRTYFDMPKDGVKYRDYEHTEKGFPFASDFIRFYSVEKARFEWTAADDDKAGQLMVILTMVDHHEVKSMSSRSLAGTIHPRSPYIAFMVDGAEQRIELLPMSTAADRKGKPRILEMTFTL